MPRRYKPPLFACLRNPPEEFRQIRLASELLEGIDPTAQPACRNRSYAAVRKARWTPPCALIRSLFFNDLCEVFFRNLWVSGVDLFSFFTHIARLSPQHSTSFLPFSCNT